MKQPRGGDRERSDAATFTPKVSPDGIHRHYAAADVNYENEMTHEDSRRQAAKAGNPNVFEVKHSTSSSSGPARSICGRRTYLQTPVGTTPAVVFGLWTKSLHYSP